jgi:ABC-type multidrug transport system ATPase subunit
MTGSVHGVALSAIDPAYEEKAAVVPSADRVGIVWNAIKYRVNAGKPKQKVILDGVSGRHENGLLAIMGPSGSGKTSLLNVLAGRVPRSKHARLEGEVLVNGQPRTDMNRFSAYVEQDEALFAFSTVRETLAFTARLRMPHGTSLANQSARVTEVIRELNLVSCADTVIGSQKVRPANSELAAS